MTDLLHYRERIEEAAELERLRAENKRLRRELDEAQIAYRMVRMDNERLRLMLAQNPYMWPPQAQQCTLMGNQILW